MWLRRRDLLPASDVGSRLSARAHNRVITRPNAPPTSFCCQRQNWLTGSVLRIFCNCNGRKPILHATVLCSGVIPMIACIFYGLAPSACRCHIDPHYRSTAYRYVQEEAAVGITGKQARAFLSVFCNSIGRN